MSDPMDAFQQWLDDESFLELGSPYVIDDDAKKALSEGGFDSGEEAIDALLSTPGIPSVYRCFRCHEIHGVGDRCSTP